MPLSQSVLSTQDVIVPLTILGPDPPDPTAVPPDFAFKPAGVSPAGADWVTGAWDPETLNGQYLMLCLVGPGAGGTALAIASYVIWNRITVSPEVPVFQSGVLAITP